VDVTVTTPSGTSATSAADQFSYVYVTAPAPAVTGIAPTAGTTAGGTVVTISGSNLTGATAVSFGGTAAGSFTVNSDGQITATSPALAAGTVDIAVTTPSATSTTSAADQFTYVAAAVPAVTGLTPSSGSTGGGTLAMINGSNFTGATGVSFGTFPASSFTVVSSIQITVTAPPQAAGTVDVTVTTPAGTSATSASDRFTYTAAPAPALTSLLPTSGSTAGGTLVTLTGTGFSGAVSVLFGSVPATSFTIVSDTSITAVAPPQAAGTWDVTVTTYTGTSPISAADRFTYSVASAPAVTAVSPTSGSTAGGTVVSVTGTNFTGASGVSFNYTAASAFTVNSATSISATAPPNAAGMVDIIVRTPSGSSPTSAADQFTYTVAPLPAVTGVSPNTGSTAGGTSATITGSAFTGATGVSFGGVAATSFTVNSDTSISAVSPSQGAGTVDVTVTTYSGTSATSAADHFTYTPAPMPAVTGITPTSGPACGGTTVTVLGSGFTGATAVSFGTTAAVYFTVISDMAITAFSPAEAAGTVDITVTTNSGTSATSGADHYTYTAAAVPSLTALTPNSGSTAGGTAVQISGSNFTSATNVTFAGTSVSFTAYSDGLITVVSPPNPAGVWDVVMTNLTGSSAGSSADRFTYTAAPAPAVTAVSPTSGSTGGGTVVTITGSNFTSATSVSFGSVAASSFTVFSDSSILATAPPQAPGTVDITVTTVMGSSATSTADQFSYTAAPAPAVTAITPASGSTAGGTVVNIAGTSFTGATQVLFGTQPASTFTVESDTQVLATAPAEAVGTVDITVTTPSGTSPVVAADRFTYTAAPVPTVTAVTPASGSTMGGTLVTVTGSGFTGATAVSFGAIPATSFTVLSDSAAVASAPAQAAGTIDITVTTPSGTSIPTAADRFTYTAAAVPTVTAVRPATGTTAGGLSLTITGTSFTEANAVSFGSVPVAPGSFTINSDSQITALVPPQAAGTVDVTVTNSTGISATSTADHFTYSAAPLPSVTAVAPSSGSTAGGTVVTLTGSGFTGATTVSFGSTAANTFAINSDTSLTATAPAHASGTVDITVTTYSGTSATSSADRFTYSAAPLPAVTAVSPTSGGTGGGTGVYITGSNFTGATGVSFGSTAASSFTVLSDTLIVATAPPQAAGTVDVKVTTYSGTSSATTGDHFTYVAAALPAVTGVAPTSGSTLGGTVVTITGSNFTGTNRVTFIGIPAPSFTVLSDTALTAVTPANSAGTWDTRVITPSGTSPLTAADQFTFTAPPPPVVTGLGPASGPAAGSTAVTIAGSPFTGATGVFFGTSSASITSVTDLMITVTSPAHSAGTVDVRVMTPGGTSAISSADRFTFV
jgi:hypothetical protein